MVNIYFETTTDAVCYHAQDVESVLCRSRNSASAVREIVSLTGRTAHADPLCVALDIGLSLPIGIDEGRVTFDSHRTGDGQVVHIRIEGMTLAVRIEGHRTGTFSELLFACFLHGVAYEVIAARLRIVLVQVEHARLLVLQSIDCIVDPNKVAQRLAYVFRSNQT